MIVVFYLPGSLFGLVKVFEYLVGIEPLWMPLHAEYRHFYPFDHLNDPVRRFAGHLQTAAEICDTLVVKRIYLVYFSVQSG